MGRTRPDELGFEFDRVVGLAASGEPGIWAVLACGELPDRLADFDGSPGRLAHFDGTRWTALSLGEYLIPLSVVETGPGVVLVGVGGVNRQHGLRRVNWATKQIEPVPGPRYPVREIIKRSDGRVLAASWFSLSESKAR
jgi:hypothetical protein